MSISQTIQISAPREAVFALYEDVASWPAWDAEVAEVSLPGGLRVGAVGWLKPTKGPKAHMQVSQVVPARSFTVESKLPLCRMQFGHELDGEGEQTRATHWVSFSGPLSFFFRRVIGGQVRASLPQTMLGLKRACEERRAA